MQKKLTVLFAFAIFVLLVGWAITPAQAHHRDEHSGGGGGGSDTGFEPATVDLAGGMLTMDLPVSVSRDSPKKIHFGDTNFFHDIVMNFQLENNDCFAVPETAADSDDISLFVNVLNTEVIDSGHFVVEVDRKNCTDNVCTGALVIQYNSNTLGFTRIQYMGNIVPPLPDVTEFPDMPIVGSTTFNFDGTIFVWQVGETTNADDKMVACPDQVVDVILRQ